MKHTRRSSVAGNSGRKLKHSVVVTHGGVVEIEPPTQAAMKALGAIHVTAPFAPLLCCHTELSGVVRQARLDVRVLLQAPLHQCLDPLLGLRFTNRHDELIPLGT